MSKSKTQIIENQNGNIKKSNLGPIVNISVSRVTNEGIDVSLEGFFGGRRISCCLGEVPSRMKGLVMDSALEIVKDLVDDSQWEV